MEQPEAVEEIESINLDGPVFAIDERSEGGIPAIEFDSTLGSRVALIFTSREAAQRYCYRRRPRAMDNIYELTRKSMGERGIVQTGLIKVARNVLKSHPEITHFVFDHPGGKGRASYLSVEDVAFLGRKNPNKESEDSSEFYSLLEAAMED